MEKTASEIATVKRNVRLQEWNRQIEEQKSSGQSIEKKETERAVVPILAAPSGGNISIEKNGLHITFPENISAEILIAVVDKLC